MDEMCETCFFYSFCKNIKLPHCNGEDYVKDKYEINKKDGE
jgi:hypothetical protein